MGFGGEYVIGIRWGIRDWDSAGYTRLGFGGVYVHQDHPLRGPQRIGIRLRRSGSRHAEACRRRSEMDFGDVTLSCMLPASP